MDLPWTYWFARTPQLCLRVPRCIGLDTVSGEACLKRFISRQFPRARLRPCKVLFACVGLLSIPARDPSHPAPASTGPLRSSRAGRLEQR